MPTVNEKLVHSCRPWIGTWANRYPQAGRGQAQVKLHEHRVGRQMDVVHSYNRPGSNNLNDDEKFFYNREDTLLYVNWKPTTTWADADGSNSVVNQNIDTMARDIKALGSKKIFLTIYHEPENNVSSGASGCTQYKGADGTPSEYREMWRTVHARFDALDVNNVVWVMNYMGFARWDCMVDDLWPGDSLVDWVTYDPYGNQNQGFNESVGRFYGYLEAHSDSTHDYTSKPWGLAEFGVDNTNDATKNEFYREAKRSVESDRFPRLKLYMTFDSIGTNSDRRIFVNQDGDVDESSASGYVEFATSDAFKD